MIRARWNDSETHLEFRKLCVVSSSAGSERQAILARRRPGIAEFAGKRTHFMKVLRRCNQPTVAGERRENLKSLIEPESAGDPLALALRVRLQPQSPGGG